MDPKTPIEQPDNATDELFGENLVAPEMKDEAIQQIELEAEVEQQPEEEITGGGQHAPGGRRKGRIHRLLEAGKNRRTTQLLLQIWKSDYSIIAFLIMMASFYLMKETSSPVIGLLFFLFAMAETDAMLSIFVVRLSFHQNQHGFYRTEDFERDWLRYRMLLTMAKAALLFVVATSCVTPATIASATIASYLMWFFTSTQRLRFIILRWSLDEHYPELQPWSIFAVLREFGIEPERVNFNLVAGIGIVVGFGIVLVF